MKTRRPRLTCFALGILGGLLAGAATMLTWRSVYLGPEARGAASVTKGVDALLGIVALVAAVAAILLTLFLRVRDTEEPRVGLVPLVLVAGVVVAAVGLLGILAPKTALGDTGQADAEKIAEALDVPVEDVLSEMDEATTEVTGPGAWVEVIGGLLIVGGGVAGFRWVRAWRDQEPDADQHPNDVETPEAPEADASGASESSGT